MVTMLSKSNGTSEMSLARYNFFGFSNPKAGYCYVGALERDHKTYVVALLACGWPNNKTYKWSDTKKLMAYGIENFEYHSFGETKINESKLKPIVVKNGQTEGIGDVATAGLEVIDHEEANENSDKEEKNTSSAVQGVLMRKDENMNIIYDIKNVLEAPVCAGDLVGTITYMVNEEKWKVENVVLTENINKIDYSWCLEMVLQKYYLN